MSVPERPHCLVFDSGMGGLTIVEELQKLRFDGLVSYAADTAFFPYGDKSDDDLIRRMPTLASTLCEAAGADMFVIACNTASTLTLELVRAVLDIPVVGTVPAIKPAARETKTGTIGVLATPGTLKRSYTDALVSEFARDCLVLTYGSVKLVELAERYATGETVEDSEISAELAALFSQPHGDKIDQVVLACTHFPLLRERLIRLSPKDVSFIDSGHAIARRVLSLAAQGDERPNAALSFGQLWTTGEGSSNDRLKDAAARFGFQSAGHVTV